MSDFDDKKRSAAQTFGNVARMSDAAEKLDPQQLMVVMTQLLAPLQPGQPLDLSPLETFLKEEKKVSPRDIEEIFIFYQSRQDKLGFPVQLPASMSGVTEARREKVVQKFRRPPPGGTFSGGTMSGAPRSGSSSEPSAPSPSAPKRPKPPREGPNHKLIAALLVVVLGGVGFLAFDEATSGPGLVTLEEGLSNPGSLPCVELLLSPPTAMCKLPGKKYESYTEEELDRRVKSSLEELSGHKITQIALVNIDNNRPLGIKK